MIFCFEIRNTVEIKTKMLKISINYHKKLNNSLKKYSVCIFRGLESIVVDYVRPILFGHVIPKIALVALHLVTIFAMGSLLYFNHNDIGFGQAVRNLWTLEPKGTKQQQVAA